jgi:hypothetical protein
VNAYASLGIVKASLRVAATNVDSSLLRLTVDVSRSFDQTCGRRFYPEVATRYYDGEGGVELQLDDDLLSITTLKLDTDGDGVFETTLSTDDYLLVPYNESPKRAILLQTSGSVSAFPIRRYAVQIVGVFGFSYNTVAASTFAEDVDNSETEITVAAAHGLTGGETIVSNSEQMYVSEVSGVTLTVVRGMNGTTETTHTNDAAFTKIAYDELIQRACVMQTARLWRDSQNGGAGQAGGADLGAVSVTSLYPAIRDMLNPRRIQAVR